MEICAVVFHPMINCPIEFDFSVSLSTCDGSAGVYKEVAILSVSQHKNCDYNFIDICFLHELAKLSASILPT